MPEVKRALKNVYFDTAASPLLYGLGVYEQVILLVGGGRILFGSDYPLLEPRRALEEVAALGLDQETKNQILSVNARRLLGIKAR
jgi:predicted TIM-barrel fold metal-dependent hydrolase